MLKGLIKTARGVLVDDCLYLKDTDTIIYSSDWIEINRILVLNLYSISEILFHTHIDKGNSNPITIRGQSWEGAEVTFVICWPTRDIHLRLYNTAYTADNKDLKYALYKVLLKLEAPRAETRPERLIIRRFETAPVLGDSND